MATVRQQSHIRLIRRVTGVTFAGSLWFCFSLLPVLASSGAVPEIVVNQGRYGPYYHMRFELTVAAIDFAESDRMMRSGGQFELRLHLGHFPVSAPDCRSSLILRMPWTAPSALDAAKKIAAKQALLERILALEQDPEAVVSVVLELNPYIEVTSRTPLQLQLTHCNLFFRHAFGGYVDYTGPLQRN